MNWGSFSNMLSPWQWGLLLAVPPAIIALYFLKLRRQPLEVPSTFLWQRAIEDMHVNSLWQRLRQNLLLLLQLLVIGLLMLACLRPSWRGTELTGDRFIFLVDTSASMSTTDEKPTRLESAKKRIDEVFINGMESGDAAMIISFSDRARVEQPFTTDRKRLREKLDGIKATQRGSDLSEALVVAAGLANPGRSGDRAAGDDPAADALPATVYIFSDGGLRSVPEFSWGNLQPIYKPVGSHKTGNVAITALGVSRNPGKTDQMQAFVRVENFSDELAVVRLSLFLDDKLLDALEVKVDAEGIGGTEFGFDAVERGSLRVEVEHQDALRLDDCGYVGINPPHQTKVLFVSPGNDALRLALSTADAARLSEIDTAPPQHLKSKEYHQAAEDGKYELIIYDQCFPEELPNANTFFVGRLPPTDVWSADEAQQAPQILDVDVAHPLLKYLDFGDVQIITSGQAIHGPSGQHVLIDGDIGPLCVIAPRDGFEDLVLGFEIVGEDDDGNIVGKTDWPFRVSFPLFVRNLLEYTGGMANVDSPIGVQPGEALMLRRSDAAPSVMVSNPSGDTTEVKRSQDGTYMYNRTEELGVYEVRKSRGDAVDERFAVNLFNAVESDVRLRPVIETAWNQVEAQHGWEATRREVWKWILLAALVVLSFEWYVYNRRVFI